MFLPVCEELPLRAGISHSLSSFHRAVRRTRMLISTTMLPVGFEICALCGVESNRKSPQPSAFVISPSCIGIGMLSQMPLLLTLSTLPAASPTALLCHS